MFGPKGAFGSFEEQAAAGAEGQSEDDQKFDVRLRIALLGLVGVVLLAGYCYQCWHK